MPPEDGLTQGQNTSKPLTNKCAYRWFMNILYDYIRFSSLFPMYCFSGPGFDLLQSTHSAASATSYLQIKFIINMETAIK